MKVAIGNIVSQNNQQNALSSGLGGVSLQTYDYDAMNRLIHSSGGNSDAGVSYNFQQTYSPSGRIGDKTCDFTTSDHLGSSSWTTDANGHAIQHIEYLPFGEELVNQRTTSYEDRYTFTGKELDAESNLYYYDARYNSSTFSMGNLMKNRIHLFFILLLAILLCGCQESQNNTEEKRRTGLICTIRNFMILSVLHDKTIPWKGIYIMTCCLYQCSWQIRDTIQRHIMTRTLY